MTKENDNTFLIGGIRQYRNAEEKVWIFEDEKYRPHIQNFYKKYVKDVVLKFLAENEDYGCLKIIFVGEDEKKELSEEQMINNQFVYIFNPEKKFQNM